MSRAFLLDVSSFEYRAFQASKERPTYTKDGIPNAAVNLFRTMLHRLKKDHKPDYSVGACDVHGVPTFRTELYPKYKANREEKPADFVAQIPGFQRVLLEEMLPLI